VAVDGMGGQVLAVAAELLERSGEAHRLPSGRVGAETTAERISCGLDVLAADLLVHPGMGLSLADLVGRYQEVGG